MSLSGMTGFARREGAHGPWTWAVEARSVNGRNLEVRFRGPPGFDSLERLAREGAGARFQRGQLNVGLQAKRVEGGAQVRINEDQLNRYLALMEILVRDGRASSPRADGLLALKGVIEAGDEDEDAELKAAVEAAMAETLASALDGLKDSRLGEGAALAPVLGGIIDRIADAEHSSRAVAVWPRTLELLDRSGVSREGESGKTQQRERGDDLVHYLFSFQASRMRSWVIASNSLLARLT